MTGHLCPAVSAEVVDQEGKDGNGGHQADDRDDGK